MRSIPQDFGEIDENDLTIPLRVRRAYAAERARRGLPPATASPRPSARRYTYYRDPRDQSPPSASETAQPPPASPPFEAAPPQRRALRVRSAPRHAIVLGVVLYVIAASIFAGGALPFALGDAPAAGVPVASHLSLSSIGPRPAPTAAPAAPAAAPAPTPAGRGGGEPLGRRREPVWYEVKPGDTLASIAADYGLDVNTLVTTNKLDENPDRIHPGERILILPVIGALHKVREGDTIRAIAAAYEVDPKVIVDLNGVTDADILQVGQELVIPGARSSLDLNLERADLTRSVGEEGLLRNERQELVLEAPERPVPTARPAPGDRLQFIWPAAGPITTRFREAGLGYSAFGHTGIDIANREGSVVRAAEAGKVVTAVKLRNSYGWYIVLDHRGGYQTLYGHLSGFLVGLGDEVERGQPIGLMGNTGYSFGPHLHFEIRRWGGGFLNPLDFLD